MVGTRAVPELVAAAGSVVAACGLFCVWMRPTDLQTLLKRSQSPQRASNHWGEKE